MLNYSFQKDLNIYILQKQQIKCFPILQIVKIVALSLFLTKFFLTTAKMVNMQVVTFCLVFSVHSESHV